MNNAVIVSGGQIKDFSHIYIHVSTSPLNEIFIICQISQFKRKLMKQEGRIGPTEQF